MKFYLDGTLVDNPTDWDELKSYLKRDDDLNGIVLFQESSLTFGGDGYDYLYSKLEDSFCNVVELKVLDNCAGGDYLQIIKGSIFVSDCKFNEKACLCNAKVEDNSFFKSINNNKSIEFSPFTDRTKNAEVLTTATTYNLDVYSVVNGSTLIRGNCQAVRVYEAFRSIIAFMSDNTVGFTSTTFGIGGDWEGLCITSGYQLRTAQASPFPQFTFEDFFNEIKARIPIGFKINDPYGSPVLQIEEESFFFNTTVEDTFEDIYEIITEFDQNKLYAVMNVGSSTVDDSFTYPFPEDIALFGFKEESFFISGECNIDFSIDLINDWILSSNIIQRVSVGSDQGYDDNLFLIDSTLVDASNGRTTNTDFLGVGSFFYNERLTNKETISRYQGFVPNNIANYLDVSGAGTFKAYLPANITHTATVAPDNDDYNPLALSAEAYDVSAAYNIATYRFTAPTSGVYTFNTNIHLTTTLGVGSVTAYFQAYIRVFNAANVLQNIGESFGGVIYGVRMFNATTFLGGVPYIGVGANATVDFTGLQNVIMQQGWYAILRFSKVGTTGDVDYVIHAGDGNTWFECAENTLGGGVYQTGEPSLYPALVHSFEHPMTRTKFDNIVNNSTSLYSFGMHGQGYRRAWIKDLVYDHTKGSAVVKLITDKTTQNAN